MKKSFFVLMLAAGFIANVNATDNAGTVISSGTPIEVGAAGCSLLSESVSINTSTGVFGAYACNTTDNIIAVSTCHPNGRKGTVAVNCLVGAPGAPADCAVVTAGCTTDNSGATPVYCAGTGTVLGGVTNVATTAGGRVGGVAAANCVTGGSTTAEAAEAAGL